VRARARRALTVARMLISARKRSKQNDMLRLMNARSNDLGKEMYVLLGVACARESVCARVCENW